MILIHENVDAYSSVCGQAKNKDEIIEILSDYHEKYVIESFIDDLINNGEAYLNDSSNTVYRIIKD